MNHYDMVGVATDIGCYNNDVLLTMRDHIKSLHLREVSEALCNSSIIITKPSAAIRDSIEEHGRAVNFSNLSLVRLGLDCPST